MTEGVRVRSIESRVSFAAGVLTSLLGFVVLIGWHAHATFLIKIDPAFEAMKYNTALGFLLSGLGLALANVSYTGIARILGGFVASMAFLTQLQNVFSLDFGIDQLLVKDYLGSISLSPGRMSPITAVCFFMAGFALCFATLATDGRSSMLAGILSAISLALGITALFGYFSDLEATYRWGGYVRIAEHTALGFTVLGIGIISLVWTREKAIGFPYWFPPATMVFFWIIAFRLWQALDATEKHGVLPETVLGLTFLMGLVIALVIDFAQRERLQAREIEATNARLEEAIARQREVDNALRESENRFKSIYESSHDAIVLFADKTFLDCNRKTLEVFGFDDKEEFLGRDPMDISPPFQPDGQDSFSAARKYIRTVLMQGEYRFEWMHRRKNGEVFPAEVLASVFELDGKKIVQGTIRDITSRKRAEEEIVKLIHAVEQSPVSVIITGKDGCIQYVNKKFCQLTGYAKEEAIGKNPNILKSGEQSQAFYRELWDTILSGKEWQGECHNKKKNDELYWENVSISSVKDARGEITHFVAVKEDITEKKRFLSALLESEERYRQFFATCSDAVILFDDATKRITDVNDAALRTYQYSREEFLALSITALSDDPVCCVQHIAETSEGKIHPVPSHFHKKKDGSVFPVEASQGAFMVKGRKVVFCIGRDISQHLENERKLRSAEKVAQISEKLAGLGTLTAGVCHETLNPLNIISMQVQMMLKHEKDNPALVEKLLKIMDEIKRIVKIMGTLMTFSRKPSTEVRSVRINDELESALTLVEKDLLLSNVAVVRDYQDSLPEIKIEPDEMRQVFLNLVNNAKYAMKSGGKLTLATRHVKTDTADYLRINIADTGSGIKKENLIKIFEPFFTTKPEGEGTGMGLPMAYSIIEKHGGTLGVESEEGKGTTFIIDLPVKKAEMDSLSFLPVKKANAD